MIENSGGRLPADECPIGRCNRRHAHDQFDLEAEWEVVEHEIAGGPAVPADPAVPVEPAVSW